MPLDTARDAVIAVQARLIEAVAAENTRLAGQVAGLAARVERLERLEIGPPETVRLIAELGEHPRDRWAEVHERHRSHFATGEPGR